MSSSTPADRKESYKAQRKNYAKQKKRVGKELLSTFKDQSIIVLADWLKVIDHNSKSHVSSLCKMHPQLTRRFSSVLVLRSAAASRVGRSCGAS